MLINLETACTLLRQQDDILILSHQKPDGDTLGSAFALLYTLEQLGKRARVECDTIPARYHFIYGEYVPAEFEPQFIVAVDVADPALLGLTLRQKYGERVDLCVDHHKSNSDYAKNTLLNTASPATAQMMYDIAVGLGAQPDLRIANALFTGLTTDTGCFRYDSVNARTHEVAAQLIGWGAQHGMINKLMFETKSRGRLEVDRIVTDSLEYHLEGLGAMVFIPAGVNEDFGVSDEELEGISAFPRTIEGIKVGITIRQRGEDIFRVSLRTSDDVDASAIAGRLGGGGHMQAAGCSVKVPTLEQAKQRILEAVEDELIQTGILPAKFRPLSGVLLIDKPEDFTSSDVVVVTKGMLKAKLGHAGTLDPMATGVLPLFIGRSTKAIDLAPNTDKGYVAHFRLGLCTDTQDITGAVLEQKPVNVTAQQVEEALAQFRGPILQAPPMYSSVKVNGQRLYDLAREGKEVPRKERPVTIYKAELTVVDEAAGEYKLEVLCSKGTYIRTLCHDLGQVLGCGAVLTALRRTMALGYPLEQCITLAEAQKLADEGRLEEKILPIATLFEDLPRVTLTFRQARFFLNGGLVPLEKVGLPEGFEGSVSVYREGDSRILGVAQSNGQELKAKVLLELEVL